MSVTTAVDPDRIRAAWLGRVTGCQLGKAVEMKPDFKAGIAEFEDL